ALPSSSQLRSRVPTPHADLSPPDHVLAAEIAGASALLDHAAVHTWYEDGADAVTGPGAVHAGLMDLSEVAVPEDAHVFLCGSSGFLRAVRSGFLDAGVDGSRIHAELFSPNDWLV